jgi:hypothetical protein
MPRDGNGRVKVFRQDAPEGGTQVDPFRGFKRCNGGQNTVQGVVRGYRARIDRVHAAWVDDKGHG